MNGFREEDCSQDHYYTCKKAAGRRCGCVVYSICQLLYLKFNDRVSRSGIIDLMCKYVLTV